MSQPILRHDHEDGSGFGFAVGLGNTWDIWFDDPERLKTTGALDEFLATQGWESVPSTDDRELEAARQLRSELRSIFASQTAHEAAAMLATLLNGLVVEPRLTVGDPADGDVAISFGPRDGADLMEQMRVVAGLGVGGALERWGVDRLRMCDADRCEDVFVDTSKNGRRRYCNVRCQNRFNVAALRRRTAEARSERA